MPIRRSRQIRRTPKAAIVILLALMLTSTSACSGTGETPTGQTATASPTNESPQGRSTLGSAATVDPTKALHKGIDVSDHSGTVDWAQVVAAGHSYAFAKATEGVDLSDTAFAENWQAMKAAGVIRGAYHFYVTEDAPLKQAQFFIETVHLEVGDLAPVVDIELLGHNTQGGDLATRLQQFLDALESHYGVRPIIYTSPNFWDENLTDDFGHYPLWIAEYEVDEPRLPNGWDTWTLWQWSADAEVPGVEQGADLSHVNASLEDLGLLLVAD